MHDDPTDCSGSKCCSKYRRKPVKYSVRSRTDNPLVLISLGDNKAVAAFGDGFSICIYGLLYRLKKRVDTGYVKKFSKQLGNARCWASI